MFELPEKIVLFDVECTTWEGTAARGWSGPGEHRELVQLGAVLVETVHFTELSPFKFLVRPKINSILSDYFIKLTGITQEEVDRDGVDFPVFLQSFYRWSGGHGLYTFDTKLDGSRLFDRDVLIENCDLWGIEFPFGMERFHNINEIFARYGISVKQSGKAPEALGAKVTHRPHDALNDVRGLIAALKILSERLKG